MTSKADVRRNALKARRSLSAGQVESLSERIQDALVALPEFLGARVVASYAAKSDEVQTGKIMRSALSSGKRLLVPRTDPRSLSLSFCEIRSLDQLAPGYLGIPEPPPTSKAVSLSESQLVVVPVVAWDDAGRRLGHGKGYFDRALRSRGRAPAAGLAFESQQRDRLPATPSDVPLDIIVTEKRVLRFGGASGG
jgi:5-formyltetrahydrofolate cyclo-ligase